MQVLQPVAVPSGQVAQLWAITKDGDPFPVAALPPLPARGSVMLPLPDTSEKLFSNVPKLMVTLQPSPAQPGDKPSGEPMLVGHCVKLW